MEGKYMYLGIDIGGTFIKYALVEKDYTITKKWKKETKLCATKDEFYDYLCEGLKELDVECIGVSAPGVIDSDSTVLSKAARNVQIMMHHSVNEEIQSRTGIKTATMNDAKAAGYCELMIGNGKGTSSSVYFVIGTGIGGCVCDRDGVIQGVNNIAGEFSNIPMGYANGKILGLSHLASMSALIDIYNSMSETLLTYGTEVCERYLANEETAVKAMDQWCLNICLGLFSIVIFYNPEVICLGGGISEEDWFIDKVRETWNALERPFKDLTTTKIDRCLYNNDANLLGAVLYATKH